MPTQAYFETGGDGDWYECIADTAAGESPATHPEKWSKLAIPSFLEVYLVERAAAILLQEDGQEDKARLQRQEADDTLSKLMIRHRDGGDWHRPNVLVRA